MLILTLTLIIKKILETSGMYDCNTQISPTKVTPLRTDANRPHHKEQWNYTSVIGILMYLSSNAHPEIKFEVHQCDWFNHPPPIKSRRSD